MRKHQQLHVGISETFAVWLRYPFMKYAQCVLGSCYVVLIIIINILLQKLLAGIEGRIEGTRKLRQDNTENVRLVRRYQHPQSTNTCLSIFLSCLIYHDVTASPQLLATDLSTDFKVTKTSVFGTS